MLDALCSHCFLRDQSVSYCICRAPNASPGPVQICQTSTWDFQCFEQMSKCPGLENPKQLGQKANQKETTEYLSSEP